MSHPGSCHLFQECRIRPAVSHSTNVCIEIPQQLTYFLARQILLRKGLDQPSCLSHLPLQFHAQ